MPSKIYCANPQAQFAKHRAEILEVITRVYDHGPYILGPEVAAFEQEFASYNNVKHCIGVGSGTDALILSMRVLGIGPGDEVITVSHTALATVAAIIATGATPVLIDIEEDYYTIDPKCIEGAITEKTRAIIPVHLYGQLCDMGAIMTIAHKHNLKVIEDCAQAHGALYKGHQVGTIGDVGCFSFYPTKNLGALGDGGGIITDNTQLADRLHQLRQYGWDIERIAQTTSNVSRLDEVQAAILRVKLKYLDEKNRQRRHIAKQYNKLLKTTPLLLPNERDNCEHVYHLYVARSGNREKMMNKLSKRNIFGGIHYIPPIHEHPGYKNRIKIAPCGLNITNKIVKEILTLPIYPEMDFFDLSKKFQEII